MAHIMMAKPIKTLELHYPMIPFLIMYNILYIYNNNILYIYNNNIQ